MLRFKLAISALIIIISIVVLVTPATSYAATNCGAAGQSKCCLFGQSPDQNNCVIADSPIQCDPALSSCKKTTADTNCKSLDCLLNKYINPIINILAGMVGIVATISIVVGGIQYASSADDPQKVTKAKERITNSIIALIAFVLLWAFLQWIIPGGIL